jgi:hypothetical protein
MGSDDDHVLEPDAELPLGPEQMAMLKSAVVEDVHLVIEKLSASVVQPTM